VEAQLTIFTDRASFQEVLGPTSSFDNFTGDTAGPIGSGSQLGDFDYSFVPTVTSPTITTNRTGNFVLGGEPYQVFVGGDDVTLGTAKGRAPVGAFGEDFSCAPAATTIPANTYTLTILDGPAAGLSVGNPPLPSAGGSFFLGFIANPGIQFRTIAVSANQTDPNTLVPAYQVDDFVYYLGTIPALYYSSVQRVGRNALFFQGGGGLPDGRFFLLSSTNLTLPLSQWSVVSTNYFDSAGGFLMSQSINKPREFFLLKPN
jgi:hypothetical protein